jgi:AcrR family transcriptional regulator
MPEEEVLRRAIEMFAEAGYEGASIRELARRMGVSHNLIHWRFGSKENLWRQAIDYSGRDSSAGVRAVFGLDYDSDEDRLRDLVIRFAEWAAANPDVIGLINIEGRRDSWRLDHLHSAYVVPFQEQLGALLDRMAKAHGAPAISSAAFMVLLVHGVGGYFALGPLMRRLGLHGDARPDAVRGEAERFADVLLGSVLGASRPAARGG